ncbi:L-aspartate oxidase [Candidatus Methylacidithermus pantelleriae]|nr:L-aspartate oxidase [Candidatus Methylacidithermus pantelleriae]
MDDSTPSFQAAREFDFVVVGSGLAGLFFAWKSAQRGTVALLTKGNPQESNTRYAQGGIACVMSPDDSLELHIQDTLLAGAGLCKEPVVRTIVEAGPGVVRELVELGVPFTARESGEGDEFDLGREGGHSRRRILHVDDATGEAIEKVLWDRVASHPRVSVFPGWMAVELITLRRLGFDAQDRCIGIYALERATGKMAAFLGQHTVLATGGCGKTYLYTSNPDVATGDGVAMAFRAGVPIANMEFIQFHPTCLYHPAAKNFLISEAVRGEGGILLNAQGQRFMEAVHPLKELAPRDVVARAIEAEIKKSGHPCVYLDIRHKGRAYLTKRFPTIYAKCLSVGLDIAEEPIPVVPAAHYQCGGIVTDWEGRTPLPGLWAIGEVACTGFHGANRLASNSLLEAAVMADRAARAAQKEQASRLAVTLPEWDPRGKTLSDERLIIAQNWREIRQLMWDYVGIVRTVSRLQRARQRLNGIVSEIEEMFESQSLTADLVELRNLAWVACLIVDCALSRRESRGLHYVLDYPEPDATRPPQDTVLWREPLPLRGR